MTRDPDAAVKAVIAGALRDTINAHGPIDRTFIGSATKRVLRQLQGEGYLVDVRQQAADALFLAVPQPCFWCGQPTSRLDLDYQAPFCNSETCNAEISADLRRRDRGE